MDNGNVTQSQQKKFALFLLAKDQLFHLPNNHFLAVLPRLHMQSFFCKFLHAPQ